MKNTFTIFLLTLLAMLKVQAQQHHSENLEIKKLRNQVYLHVSYLQTESFGKVACNGMVVINQGKAVVFDTPTSTIGSLELIKWVKDVLKCKIIAIVPTHFHEDCLGGLEEFHKEKIPSYAYKQTIVKAKENGYTVPQNGFEERMELKLGKQKVYLEFFGEGHTRDNIIGYYPNEKTIFGGCLVKEVNASKGYIGDANVSAWPSTIVSIKTQLPKLELVIPGHGQPGGTELLVYTEQLFK